ncbi:MAG: GNAT family N-acetyltransferase [Burkholderiales bacterium]|nr:GNAT family N-acetyltransferase [Burkholderiales bacterium]
MLTITSASIEDAPTMLDIQRRAFAEEGRRVGRLEDGQEIPPLAEPLADLVEHIEGQTALVAREGNRIVGAVRGIVTGRVCVIRALVVDTDRQGQGIGSALLHALERRLADVDRYELTTNPITAGNVPFYERHGYRLTELTHYSATVRLAQMAKPGRGEPRQ